MGSTTRATRWLGGVLAGVLILATALFLVLSFDLLGAPPDVPASADLPTRILAFQEFGQSRWPVDYVASLSYAVAFAIVVVIAGLFAARDHRDTRAAVAVATLAAGGILGALSQLVHIGEQQVVNTIGYCDCGFKTEEAISQVWGVMLLEGVSGWLLNGASLLLAVGLVFAGRWLAGRGMPAAWSTMSSVAAAVLAFGTLLGIVLPDASVGPIPLFVLIVAVSAGVLLPIWAAWLARDLADPAGPTTA